MGPLCTDEVLARTREQMLVAIGRPELGGVDVPENGAHETAHAPDRIARIYAASELTAWSQRCRISAEKGPTTSQ